MKHLCLLLVAAFAAIIPAKAQDRQISDLPTLYIDLANPGTKINKETYENCTVEFVGAGSDTIFPDGRIRGRGNSTWVRGDKLPYKLKFESKHRLLGEDRANAKKWVLFANNFDKTLIRNAVASFIALQLGQRFAPGVKFVDMVLDGRFVGNYQITDQVDIRKRRVNITEQELPADETSDITGGYLLECINGESDPNIFYTAFGSSLLIKSPDEDVINDAQYNYIRNHIDKFEQRLFGSAFKDPERGYRPMVDSLSLASWYLTNELAMNPDTFWSSFVYKERGDDRIYFGPVWDFDIAFNNSARLGDASDKLMVDVAFHSFSNAGAWLGRMRQDPWFNDLLGRQWEEAIDNGLEEKTMAYIDSMAALLEKSQRFNYEIYNINQAYWDEMVLFNTYSEGVDFLKSTICNRIAFMNEVFGNRSGNENPVENPRFVIPTQAGGYHIYNLGAMMPVAPGEKGNPVIRDVSNPEDDEFIWDLVPDGDYFRIINRKTGQAIADRGSDSHGQTLTLRNVNSSSKQLWDIRPLYNSDNACVVANVATDLAWNNNGGHAVDGNALISWTNDLYNSSKPTRQWCFQLVDTPQDAINEVEAEDYRVTYSPSARVLRFVAAGSGELSGEMELYDLSGRLILRCPIAPEVSLSARPSAICILRWQTSAGHPRSTKLRI